MFRSLAAAPWREVLCRHALWRQRVRSCPIAAREPVTCPHNGDAANGKLCPQPLRGCTPSVRRAPSSPKDKHGGRIYSGDSCVTAHHILNKSRLRHEPLPATHLHGRDLVLSTELSHVLDCEPGQFRNSAGVSRSGYAEKSSTDAPRAAPSEPDWQIEWLRPMATTPPSGESAFASSRSNAASIFLTCPGYGTRCPFSICEIVETCSPDSRPKADFDSPSSPALQ